MAYVVRVNNVNILHRGGDLIDVEGKKVGEDHVSVHHLAGDVIADDELAEAVKRTLVKGDPHITSLLEYCETDEEAAQRAVVLANPQAAALAGSAAHLGGPVGVSAEQAADMAALGPEPLDAGVTGLTAAPGVVSPVHAAAKKKAEEEAAAAEAEAASRKTPGRPKKNESKDAGASGGAA